jgi:hypothetical protein
VRKEEEETDGEFCDRTKAPVLKWEVQLSIDRRGCGERVGGACGGRDDDVLQSSGGKRF